ncbi:hypothetical protein B0O80DRAFT_458027 [Mortierella sp. GBAus27b]|nr:Aureobasidin resistance protein Aur1 [Mortierella sp. GBA43]KAI8350529.1 hypothetical protein B0O80DRAFT_458027 [Mortierella sp. GBAus27b]
MVPPASLPRPLHRVNRALKSALVSTFRPIQQHRFSVYDLQYVFLFVLFTFCYWIMDKPVWFKLPIALTSIGLLIPRRTRQFMLPFFAVAAWLILFYCCRFIPSEWRPHIFTSVLPALENILYGGSISEMLATTTSPFKDIMAWIPYGVLHYVMPIVTAILIVFFAPPGTLPVFARTFGYMNVAGVMTQILFPCAPPWYETRYGGLQPAAYTMPGDPGGLARVDDILGIKMYGTTFTASPLVFGAFPSLHSADAVLISLFVVFVFGPRSIPFAMGYIFWIWWATMYLRHHYVVDLVGGGGYAVIAFWIATYFLPSVLPQEDTDYLLYNKAKLHHMDDAMDHREKHILFRAPDYDDEEEEEEAADSSSNGSGRNKTWDVEQQADVEHDFTMDCGTDTIELNSVIVSIPTRGDLDTIEEERMARSEPASPTDSTDSYHSSGSAGSSTTVSSWVQRSKKQNDKRTKSSNRQSWNGWQGYESWVEVLATVNTPRTSPKTSPGSSPTHSPRTSTTQGSPF